ncbi:hypothetical protein GLOIN_2v1774909 [Rhizophagus clarus]|uniref:Uncharacterized protein n=1 Tax=Rhizophagus clarus TaxID=94130 RepID=A0A8H3KW11_9GLOM|nr:hypothetical protein GLOIN_2v1774909 [Rhizophagus clarus]
MAHEATESIYSYCYLAGGISFYENNFRVSFNWEEPWLNRNQEGRFYEGVRLGICTNGTGRKRKVNEMEDEQDVDKVFGIVTDTREWYFMECILDGEGKPSFKLSEPVSYGYMVIGGCAEAKGC